MAASCRADAVLFLLEQIERHGTGVVALEELLAFGVESLPVSCKLSLFGFGLLIDVCKFAGEQKIQYRRVVPVPGRWWRSTRQPSLRSLL